MMLNNILIVLITVATSIGTLALLLACWVLWMPDRHGHSYDGKDYTEEDNTL